MDFLEKLNYLMEKNHLNKSTLSKACNIPYTTIDGWYKKGYEGLKLTTLRKLAEYFGTSLDYWAFKDEDVTSQLNIDDEVRQLTKQYSLLNNEDQELVKKLINSLVEKQDYVNNADISENEDDDIPLTQARLAAIRRSLPKTPEELERQFPPVKFKRKKSKDR